MNNREIINELIEKQIKKLKEADYARPVDYMGIDKYDSDEQKADHSRGFEKYMKLQKIQAYLGSDDKSKTKLSQIIPDWKEIIQELLKDEMKRLEKNDYARPVDYMGIDKYDSDEQKAHHAKGYEKYTRITGMNARLENDKIQSSNRNRLLSTILPKKETTFLDER